MRSLILISLLFLPLIASAQPANFIDFSAEAGIDNIGRNYGVAFGDYDGDGREDIYISRHLLPNLLYRSIGGGRFIDVAAQAGVAHEGTTTNSVWGDIDNDGDLDLYLGNRDENNILYLNNGDGTFSDISVSAGVNSAHFTRAVLFGDIDRDSYIDLYVANMNAPNYLYYNNGDNTFTNIVEEANTQDFGIAMGSLFFDYDNDGDLDLYLTHDGNQENILYMNTGDGNFINTSSYSGANISAQAMGVDVGDLNNDGFLDIYITNLYSNELLLNDQDGTFSTITSTAGVGDLGMGWGTAWLDYDNDGWQDIYVSNDSYFTPMPNILYRNRGDQTFEIKSDHTPLESMYGGYGLAVGDVNQDGKVDIFQANNGDDPNQLFINNALPVDNHWIKMRFKGTQSNAAAIGTKVFVYNDGMIMTDEVCAGSSYASQNSFILHFGLGQQSMVEEIEIRWPNGLVETYTNIEADRLYDITEGEGIVSSTSTLSRQILSSEIFPVPASPQQNVYLNLELKETSQPQIVIYNSTGQQVYYQQMNKLPAGQHQINIANTQLTRGLYYCHIVTSTGSRVHKLIYH
jgi:hypothetical protein